MRKDSSQHLVALPLRREQTVRCNSMVAFEYIVAQRTALLLHRRLLGNHDKEMNAVKPARPVQVLAELVQ